MAQVIGVRFRNTGKVYYFDPLNFDVKVGDDVIVETARGAEYGTVTMARKEVEGEEVVAPLKSVIRMATEADRLQVAENIKKEKEAREICVKKIQEHGLDMHLVDVEYVFDGNKILFNFTSEGRVDFRELVKDLASVFRTRIELRQIGVRDEAQRLGGLGICGRNLCCHAYLDEFQPVSIKMAKEQNLSLNPTKISGSCGRLMCCLKYEQEAYEDLNKVTPRVGAIVDTPHGKGTVTAVSLLKGILDVRLEDGDQAGIEKVPVSEVTVIQDGKRRRNHAKDDTEQG